MICETLTNRDFFAMTVFNDCFIILSPSLFFDENPPFCHFYPQLWTGLRLETACIERTKRIKFEELKKDNNFDKISAANYRNIVEGILLYSTW